MPTKAKLPRNKVPPRKVAKPQDKRESSVPASCSGTDPPKTASGLNQEAEDQFELELCWCIQRLQAGLSDLKLQEKQVYNLTKSLNVLKSNNASLIKKRQVMRNTFGDYRSKMAEDEKRFGKTTSVVKFITSNNKKIEKKSSFYKKAHHLNDASKKEEETETADKQPNTKVLINPEVSKEPFRFNFSYVEV